MSRWAIYDETGRIHGVYSGTEEEAALQPKAGEFIIPIADGLFDTTAHVSNGQALEKQPFALTINKVQITANGTDEAIITNIPTGTTVQWPDGQTDEVTDGEVRFSVDLPGTYTLKFSAIPYLDQEVVIEAVAPA